MAGHLVRMSDYRAVKKVFLGENRQKKRSRRPKLRWFDCIGSDLKSTGVKRWRNKSEDRYT